MQKLFTLLSTFILTASTLQGVAQRDFSEDPYYTRKFIYEVGASVGVMNCLTDLGGGKGNGKPFIKDVNVGSTEPEGSIYYIISYKDAVRLRIESVWGVVKAKDAVLKGVKESTGGRYERNLSFRSSIFEVSLMAELHPLYFKKFGKDDKLPRLSPYVAGGIGYFVYNPRTKLPDGTWVDLKPLHTEGQGFAEYPDRKEYNLKQVSFPFGAGVRYKLSENVSLAAECIYRVLNTDYLDDVSTTYIDKNVFQKYLSGGELAQALLLFDRQAEITPTHTPVTGDIRGNPKKNDSFFSINFKIGYFF